jgi:hypothetical protein
VRLHLLSDLHLERGGGPPLAADADVLVLAASSGLSRQRPTVTSAGSVGFEGMELGPSPRGDLQHLPAIEVAGVDDEGDAWVALEQLSEP